MSAREPDKEFLCDRTGHLDSTIIYTGTVFNFRNLIFGPLRCDGCPKGLYLYYPILLIAGLVDLPLDIAADTLFLPYTVPLSLSLDCKGELNTIDDRPESNRSGEHKKLKINSKSSNQEEIYENTSNSKLVPMYGKPPSDTPTSSRK